MNVYIQYNRICPSEYILLPCQCIFNELCGDVLIWDIFPPGLETIEVVLRLAQLLVLVKEMFTEEEDGAFVA